MDVGIINPFLEATLEVTRTMANMESRVGKPALKKGNQANGEVTGFIALSGPAHKGTLAITFEKEALLAVYERMLGEKLSELDDSALDLAGEITNMVCGGAKQRLSSSGYDFDLTRPTILTGKPHEINHPGNGPVLTLPLELDQGKMYIEVNLSR
ncbi:chemotaxis protein CheX [Reinekea marinisedimentorum]|uniref:Chemotaxis protein CheX n=1 Tax=Reinekea marinisedimentorum TaxID=230495 RepID=A0A4R3I4W9_9GAMM|nr:chemotaxis protein CheX [Reinekea marinisedimentorum]TCS40671.1 chemotaxis protein CheX [Reinekea marinisedimentorum]